jgi:hypothetical protein
MKKLFILLTGMLTFTTTVFAQIGSADKDLVFTPITPCRIVDTRFATGGPVLAGSTRVFKAWAPTYAAQGGSASNCGILQSNDVAALALNLLVIVPSGEGFIKAWPVGVAQPNASTLNYKTNDVLANSATLKVSQVSGDWNLYSVSTTHFAADVVGYYSKPVSVGSLECTTQIPPSQSIADGFASFLNTPNCATGYIATAPYCWNNNYLNVYSTGSGVSGTGGFCSWRNQSGAAAFVFTGITCCRIPGR